MLLPVYAFKDSITNTQKKIQIHRPENRAAAASAAIERRRPLLNKAYVGIEIADLRKMPLLQSVHI
jgi:hypothetical protein